MNRRPDLNHDQSKPSYYTEFVEELARALDLNAGLAEALMNARYAALSTHIAEALDLDAGLRAALRASPPNEDLSKSEILVTTDVAPRTSSIDPARPEDAQEATKPGVPPVYEELFADGVSLPSPLVGLRGSTACQVAGITYRQLDYWAQTGLVMPSIHTGDGSEIKRLYSFKDILLLNVVKRLLDIGVELQNIRVVVDYLRRREIQDLARVTFFSDGTTVYECSSPEEVVDLLQSSQDVFGIAVSGALREISGKIKKFSPEKAEGDTIIATNFPEDKLNRRWGIDTAVS